MNVHHDESLCPDSHSYCGGILWPLPKNHLIWTIVVPVPRVLMCLVSSRENLTDYDRSLREFYGQDDRTRDGETEFYGYRSD